MKYVFHCFLLSLLLPCFLTVSTARADEDDGLHLNDSVSSIADKADSFAAPREVSVVGGAIEPYLGDGFDWGAGRSSLPLITFAFKRYTVTPDPRGSSENQSSCQQGSRQRLQTCGGAIASSYSGDDLPPADRPDFEQQLQEFDSLLAELEKEMAQLVGEVVLLTDLDETLLPTRHHIRELTKRFRQRFAVFVDKWRQRGKLRLIVVTGAIIGHDEWHYFADNQLPEPDYLVSIGSGFRAFQSPVNVMARPGTRFYGALMPGFSLFPGDLFIRPDGFRFERYLSCTAGLENQLVYLFAIQDVAITDVHNPEPGPIYAFTVDPQMNLNQEKTRELLRQVAFNLFGALAEVRFNPDKHQVTLSLPLTKREWVSRLARVMGVSGSTIIAAGDNEIDQDLLVPGKGSDFSVDTAIVVGNASRHFKKKMMGSPGVEISTFSCIVGVAQGFLRGLRKIVADQATRAEAV